MDKMTEIEILFVAEMSVEQGNDLMPLIEAQGWNIDTLHSQDKEFYYIELVKTGFIRTWYLSEALEKAFSLLDVNMIIANNIQAELKKENKKQVDLAEGIGVSRQTMSKIMNGARAINAIELHKISEYLHVSMDSLMKMPEKPMDTSVIHAFMGRVKTEEARKGIRLADELSDMILFHTRVCENGKKMEQPWEDK